MKKNLKIQIKYIYLILFITAAYILLPVMNGDYLYTIQDNSVFIGGSTFMKDLMGREGGWLSWCSCYLTQFFYHPWLGSTILILLWSATFLMLVRAFRISSKWSFLALLPQLFFLFELLDYGYWLYYSKTIGWAFNHTLLFFFITLAATLLIGTLRPMNIFQKKVVARTMEGMSFVLMFVLGTWLLGSWKFFHHPSEFTITMSDANFKHEMRMYRALDEFRFDDVLNEYESIQETPTNLMVLYKNIALMHTGQMDKMFATGNCGIKPEPDDSIKLRTSQLGAPLIYYLFGHINYAYRWAFENSVQYRLSFRNLKMMAVCAIFNKDFDVAAKYLTMLKTSAYYRQWAFEHEAWMLNSTKFVQSKDYEIVTSVLNDQANLLDGDDGLCQRYLLEFFSDLEHPNTPLLEDVCLCMSLWSKDYYTFALHFYDYVNKHPNRPIPELYQEGAILQRDAEESPIDLSGFMFDEIVNEKYKSFAIDYFNLQQRKLSPNEIAQQMKPRYGNTYWWYYYFYNDFEIY